MKHSRHKASASPLDQERLERLALAYVGRYATTRAKLRKYLERKIMERGWEGNGEPPVAPVADRMAELGFIDDAAFAMARAEALKRKGLGGRRLGPVLRAAGVEEEDSIPAREAANGHARASALRFAQRKRIGPFAAEVPDRETKAKQFAMLMRAGHPVEIARRLLDSAPGEMSDWDDL